MPAGCVPDEGPRTARVAVVGEAPGRDEIYLKRSFVGMSGKLQDRWIESAGLRRRDLYITNVLDTQPPNGGDISNAANEDIQAGIADLHQRLNRLPNIQVIAAVGTYAAHALLGVGKVKWLSTKEAKATPGITSVRGYYYKYTTLSGRIVTVIPMLHPASVIRSDFAEEPACVEDWRKVAQALAEPWPVVSGTHVIDPSESDVCSYTEMVERWAGDVVLATDVETWGNTLNCVGFAHDPHWSITIPLEEESQRKTFAPYVRRLLMSRSQKALHNGVFDAYWFRRTEWVGVFIPDYNWLFDSLFMHHALDAFAQHTLNYVTSRYLRTQYWKDEGAKGVDIKQYIANLSDPAERARLHYYNGKDCTNTRGLVDPLYYALQNAGLWEFYLNHYATLYGPMVSASTTGVRVDRAEMSRLYQELRDECAVIREATLDLTEQDLFSTKDFSTKKLQQFFYDQHGCTKQYTKRAAGKKTVSLNDTALRRIALQYPGKLADIAHLILKYRRNYKQSTFLAPGLLDADDRMRCTYSLNTSAGRGASSGNPMSTGMNLQNQDKSIRYVYKPDHGHEYMLKVDLSTAENRIVDAYIAVGLLEQGRRSECDFYIQRANAKPWEWDQHRARAAGLFGVSEDTVDKTMRNVGKMVVHAAQRNMAGQTLSDRFLKQGWIKDEKESQSLIEAYHASDPEIRRTYFKLVEQRMIRDHRLVNPFGRVLNFGSRRLTGKTYRQGYSFLPQSTIADKENTHIWAPTYRYCKEHYGEWVRLQIHDEIVVSCTKKALYDIARFIVGQCEIPIRIGEWDIVVPGEVTVSSTWQGGVEMKRFPDSEEEFYALVDTI